MKRSVLFICVFALLCAALCGCGAYRNEDEAPVTPVPTPVVTVEPIPEASPMITLDPNDGVVKDTDGVIGNHDGAGASPSPSVSPSPSASPSVSAKP